MAVTNAQGHLKGTFKIPAKIKAGTKQVLFTGDTTKGVGKFSHAETTFTGQGTVVTNLMRNVTNVMKSYYDPLAQTFMLNDARQIVGMDVYVVTKGTTPLMVQLRETSVGFPTRNIIAEGRIDPSDPAYAPGWVSVNFDKPFYASPNIEYAVVVLASDSATSVAISELGRADIMPGGSGSYVTTQPYQIGVLLSSANGSTWSAHQDKDLTFKLRARKYNKQTKSIALGKITLPAGTTDLLISALTDTPATQADADLVLTFPNPTDPTRNVVQSVSDGQVIKFTQITTGDVDIVANLRCTETASATIQPGSQIIAGVMQNTGEYISRSFPADTTAKTDLTVTVEGIQAGGIKVYYFAHDTGSIPKPIPDATGGDATTGWKEITQSSSFVPLLLDNGRYEYVFKTADTAAKDVPSKPLIKLKIELTGNASQRPKLFNLRASIV